MRGRCTRISGYSRKGVGVARPIKEGVEYFPLDIDMDSDDKIYMIEAEHGLEGFAILIKLLMEIYRNGYYYQWDERTQLVFSGKRKIELKKVLSVVESAVKCGFFSDVLFEKYGILTSHGIQNRYVLAKKRHKKIIMFRQYCLLGTNNDENAAIILENVTETPRNVPESTQRKGKERKGKSSSSVVNVTLTREKNKPYLPLSQSLLDIQLEIDSNFKPRKKSQGSEETVEEWANDFRLLVETDKRPIQTVRDVLTWLQNGSGKDQTFWRRTVSSASGFRRNFPTIYRQYSETANQESKKEEEKRVPFWTCPHCDYKNTQTGSICFNCKKERWPDEIPDDFKDDITF